jgi:hypothetical protein
LEASPTSPPRTSWSRRTFGFGGAGGHDLPFVWKTSLVGEVPPDTPLTGVIQGELFEFHDAVLLPGSDTIHIDDVLGRRVSIQVRCGRDEACPIGTVVSITRPPEGNLGRGDNVPPIVHVENEDGSTVVTTERGFVIIMKVGKQEGNEVPVRMYLCLPREEYGFMAGTFRARIEG